MARRARLKERRLDGSRQEVLEAARAVLGRVGVGRLTLELVASELGVTKQALYHYFASKHALLFDIILAELSAAAHAVRAATEAAPDGGSALEAVIRAYVGYYAPRLDVFRLVTVHVQQVDPSTVEPAMLAKIRPLNDVMFDVAVAKLEDGRRANRGRRSDPLAARRLVFSAYVAANGLLTMKALVERFEDPLRYSDDQLVEELCRAFRASAEKEGFA